MANNSSKLILLIALVLYLCDSNFIAACGSSALVDETWHLVWSDEFDGAAGAPPCSSKWVYDIGDRNGVNGSNLGWGNQELEYYTNSTDNVRMDGQGNLVIEARVNTDAALKCYYGTCNYTSGRIHTGGKFSHKYGLFEAKIKIPVGQGIWPAFWMLGTSFLANQNWPFCGEIDIMENIGKEPMQTHGALHGPGYDPSMTFNSTAVVGDAFHRFTVVWNETAIVWYVDDVEFGRQLAANANSTQWVFNNDEFYILLNVAVGGGWPGNPNASTVFPQQMVVDYVRVYEHQQNANPPPPPSGGGGGGAVNVSASVTTVNTWNNGGVFAVVLKNNGAKSACKVVFKIVLASGQSISNIWNANAGPSSSGQYTVSEWVNIAAGSTNSNVGMVISASTGGTIAPPSVSVVSAGAC